MTTDKRIIAKGCSVYGCCKPSVSKGFCDTHRKRLERHGSILQTRPGDWGLRDKHPLRHTWRGFDRLNGGLHEEWKDFWKFVEAVGEKPSNSHTLSRIQVDQPLGPGNWYWRESIVSPEKKANKAGYMREYSKARRKNDPWHEFRNSLKRHYGITVEEYCAMHEAQNGVCAICGKPELSVDGRTGNVRRLAVDHCHESNKIRGLLCAMCNTGIGALGDDIANLLSAIEYLKKSKC